MFNKILLSFIFTSLCIFYSSAGMADPYCINVEKKIGEYAKIFDSPFGENKDKKYDAVGELEKALDAYKAHCI